MFSKIVTLDIRAMQFYNAKRRSIGITKYFYWVVYSKKTTVNSCFYYNSEKG